jgi:hypothetical protein
MLFFPKLSNVSYRLHKFVLQSNDKCSFLLETNEIMVLS